MTESPANSENAFARQRLRRPIPERTEPLRGVLGAFGRADWRGGAGDAGAHPLGFDTGQGGAAGEPPEFADSDIRAASALIDRHIANNRQADFADGAGIMDQLSRLYANGLPPELSDLVTGVTRSYADLLALWVALAGGIRDALKPSADGQGLPAQSGVAGNVGAPVLSISANRPVEARVEMFRPAGNLTAQPLQPENPALAAAIISITAEAGRVDIVVPDDQPAGTYHGLLLDQAAGPAGAVTLRIAQTATDGGP